MKHLLINIEEITKKKIYYGIGETPFGDALIGFYEKKIFWLSFSNDLEEMKIYFKEFEFIEDCNKANLILKEIFSNKIQDFNLVVKGTSFQKQVWKELLNIPCGTTTTYKNIAKAIDKPQSTRAVATAIGKNNISYLIPCHRVIGKDGKLRGYRWGLDIKMNLLNYEKTDECNR